jgi:hypothetical protein
MKSPWVDWEWRTALATKSITGIQPHPLEPAQLAPPPKELSDLQFGSMYEWYILHLRKTRFGRYISALVGAGIITILVIWELIKRG